MITRMLLIWYSALLIGSTVEIEGEEVYDSWWEIPLLTTKPPPTTKYKQWTATQAVSSSPGIEWYTSWLYSSGFRLLHDANADGSYPAVVLVEEGDNATYHPVCDDGFTDRLAQALCEMYSFHRGYRTTYKTDSEFLYTGFSCFEGFTLLDKFVMSESDCTWEDYSQQSLPCSKNQAAAVHCYDLDRTESYTFDFQFSRSTEKSYTVTFGLDLFKNGKKFSVFGKQGIKDHPIDEDFVAEACGEEFSPKLSVSPNEKMFELSGKFKRKCNECVDLFYYGQYIYTVCQDD